MVTILCIYFAWLALQNIAVPWAYHQQFLSLSGAYLVMALKDVILVIALVTVAPRLLQKGFCRRSTDFWAIGYIALLAIYLAVPDFLHLDVPIPIRIITFRSLIAFVMFYFWGRGVRLRWIQWKRLALFALIFHVAVSGFGIFERFCLPLEFWSRTIGVGDYLLDVKQLADYMNVQDGLPSNLFQFDLRRLMSVYADPLGMGIASVFPFAMAMAFWLLCQGGKAQVSEHVRRFSLPATLVIGAALLLTIARESIGAAALAVVTVSIVLRKTTFLAIVTISGLMVLLLAPSLWMLVKETVTFHEASAATHLNFVSTGLRKLPTLLMGRGVGTTGAWAVSLSGGQLSPDVGESSYLELAEQGGFLSVLLFTGFLISLCRACLREYKRSPHVIWQAVFLSIIAALLPRMLVAIFSPSFFALIPMAILFFLAGSGLTMADRLREEPGAMVLADSGQIPVPAYA